MNMKNEKDLWIDRLMKKSKRADFDFESKNDVFVKILERIDRPQTKSNIVTFSQFRLAGVAAIAILALNIAVIAFSKVQDAPNKDAKTAYELSTYNLDLYQ